MKKLSFRTRLAKCLALTSCLASLLLSSETSFARDQLVWIGGPAGIHKAILNTEKGTISTPELAADRPGAGFLTINKAGTRLYATGGSRKTGGTVAAYAIADGQLTFLNEVSTDSGASAHIALDETDSILFSAQYGGGTTSSYALKEDGSIKKLTMLMGHEGDFGPNESRQTKPHPHWVGVSPDNKWLLVPDLGLDDVIIYEIDHEGKKISPHGRAATHPGGGPRHFVFGQDGKQGYLLNELDLTVTVYDYDGEAGTLTATQVIESVPRDELNKLLRATCSEIRLHPNGKFLYTGNRGHDSITAFAISPDDGKLSLIENENARASWPRNFNLDPTGKWMLVGGQMSNTVGLFSVDPETGELQFQNRTVNSPAPICFVFQP